MKERETVQKLKPEQLDDVSGGGAVGIYMPGQGSYLEEAKAFFRQCVGDETYNRAMGSEAGRRHHYVVARAFLDQTDWAKFMWIEKYGSLEGFTG